MKPYYKEINKEITIFKHAFKNKIPLMLKGPTGCGKSRFVEAMANCLKRPLIQIACNEETSAVDLQGRYLLEAGNTTWNDGPATIAARTGAILYLDEISEAREDVLVVIHPLTDHRREIYIDKKNELLKASNEFMLVASYNPGYQSRFKELKPSTKQRFLALQFNYPEAHIEETIICCETYISSSKSKKLVLYAQKLRNLKDLELLETVSTRLLVNTAKLIVSGIDTLTACNVGIIQPLTDDINIQNSLYDISTLIF